MTDRPVSQSKRPVYFLVGAFIPFSKDEAYDNYVAETELMHAQNIQGPVQLESQVDDKKKTLYFTEVLSSKRVEDTEPALLRMKARIDSMHRCKAVFRIHADRAQELSGERISATMAKLGVLVTSTAGVDSNANGRAERGARSAGLVRPGLGPRLPSEVQVGGLHARGDLHPGSVNVHTDRRLRAGGAARRAPLRRDPVPGHRGSLARARLAAQLQPAPGPGRPEFGRTRGPGDHPRLDGIPHSPGLGLPAE